MSSLPHSLSHAHPTGVTRARLLRMAIGLSAGAALPMIACAQVPTTRTSMKTRPIPSTKEELPVIGCGTWVGFGHAPGSAEYQRLPGVLQALFDAGGTLLDSSPMYGRAEQTTGELVAAAKDRARAFLATKVWTRGREAGIAQMEESFRPFSCRSY
jgi:Aldo/keto reductase family